jgi:hypothetical protein
VHGVGERTLATVNHRGWISFAAPLDRVRAA